MSRDRLRTDSQAVLFFNRWTYVERVDIDEGDIRVSFNPSTETPGPFVASMMFEDLASDRTIVETFQINSANASYRFPIPVRFRQAAFWFTLTLDDCLAFQGKLVPSPQEDLWNAPF